MRRIHSSFLWLPKQRREKGSSENWPLISSRKDKRGFFRDSMFSQPTRSTFDPCRGKIESSPSRPGGLRCFPLPEESFGVCFPYPEQECITSVLVACSLFVSILLAPGAPLFLIGLCHAAGFRQSSELAVFSRASSFQLPAAAF